MSVSTAEIVWAWGDALQHEACFIASSVKTGLRCEAVIASNG